ncbi:YgjP-like metallopeptidase domain-containing protein [Clostridium sp. AF02-29]|nr:YgjP-like metallopeptidase domain-containing protein [Clostridium sp. AF02-29]
MHLQVKPPDGHVVISAPLAVDDKAIEAYARTQLGFIKKSIAQFQDQPRASKRQYVSGETMYIWGKQYFLVFTPDNQKNSFEIQNQNIVLSMNTKSTVKQRDAYVKEEYRKILKEEIEKCLPKWEAQTGLKCDSWQTKYMITKWGACSTDKKKLWFNLQLVQKPHACLDYVILHELTHLLTRKHDVTFIAHMDKYMPNWREVRKELNDSRLDYYEAQDESPLQKLIDQSRYDDIRDAAIAFIQEEQSGDAKKSSVIDAEIENVIHIEQPEEGIIAFDVIASCDVEMPPVSRKGYFIERWLKIHCQVTLGIDMSGFRIMAVGDCEPQEESDNDRLSGELVPLISRDQFEYEAEKFLARYCPETLDKPIRVPIEKVASDMKLQVIEDIPLSDDLAYFGTVIFDNGNVLDKHRKITIRNAKRGTIYLDPRVSYERSVGTKRTTLAHECFHWYRHQPYHVLMKMIGANDNLGMAIQCQIAANNTDSDKWKAVDWMEWQAKGVAPRILMPEKTTRMKVDELLSEYGGSEKASIIDYENVIDELAELFDVSRQAAKVRLIELGYSKAEGVYPFVDGKYICGYSFKIGTLKKNQTFTIPYADLFKAYCFDRKFKKLIDSGQFVFVDRHLVVNNKKYVGHDQGGNATLSGYALSHMDECCVVFSKGYSYQSKYQGARYYIQFMRNSAPVENQIEYSFEFNTHNKALLEQIKNAKRRSEALRRYPGSFAETLVALQKERKLSNRQLADASLVGEKTIQRLRNDEEYPTSVQTVLALCIGLKLPLPEAEMFLGKTDFKLNSMKKEGYVYQCVLAACTENSIYEINEMLKENGITPLGSDPLLQ